jgi:hypothetical protein
VIRIFLDGQVDKSEDDNEIPFETAGDKNGEKILCVA